MATAMTRDYCLRRPRRIIGTFGLGVYLRLLFGLQKSLLEAVSESNTRHGIAMPGQPGNAYRIASIIEFRVARIYGLLAERFSDLPEVSDFYRELQAEEEEHGRVMLLCLYAANNAPALSFVPTLSDPEIRKTLDELRSLQARASGMSLDEALTLTEKLEKSEINVVFATLLRQVRQPAARFVQELLESAEGHAESVPRRIRELQGKLGSVVR